MTTLDFFFSFPWSASFHFTAYCCFFITHSSHNTNSGYCSRVYAEVESCLRILALLGDTDRLLGKIRYHKKWPTRSRQWFFKQRWAELHRDNTHLHSPMGKSCLNQTQMSAAVCIKSMPFSSLCQKSFLCVCF